MKNELFAGGVMAGISLSGTGTIGVGIGIGIGIGIAIGIEPPGGFRPDTGAAPTPTPKFPLPIRFS